VDASGQERYAIIPGIFKSDDPAEHHSFVQVLNGRTGRVVYHRFPANAFHAAPDRFEVTIGACRFTQEHIALQLGRPEQTAYGEVHLRGLTPWPVRLRSPGIMGPLGWLPNLECNHGVISLDHRLCGTLVIDGAVVEWEGGRGYIEKDWGASFPSAWVWMQSNHFARAGTSLTASIATVPMGVGSLVRSFRGQIVGLWHEERLYRFATYTGARVEQLVLDDESVTWVVRGRCAGGLYRLEMRAWRAEGGALRGPSLSDMGVRVSETLSARIEVRLSRLRGRRSELVLEDTGRYAGLEVVGNLERLKR
jgi:hypothetical protein